MPASQQQQLANLRPLYQTSEWDQNAAREDIVLYFRENCADGSRPDSPNGIEAYLPNGGLNTFYKAHGRCWSLLENYFPHHHHHRPTPKKQLFNRIKDGHQKIFIILVWIGKAHEIQHFVGKDDLRDERLPFFERPPSFPDFLIQHGDVDSQAYWDSFREAQWRFCAPVLTHQMERTWHKDTILPIIRHQLLGEGDSGVVHAIEVEETHNELEGPSHESLRGIGATQATLLHPPSLDIVSDHKTWRKSSVS
jgi:hypothetical protein